MSASAPTALSGFGAGLELGAGPKLIAVTAAEGSLLLPSVSAKQDLR